MPTLYVENVPDDLYEALRARAQRSRTSISSEVISLLRDNVPTDAELLRRRTVVERARQIRKENPPIAEAFASTEEMLRSDRAR